MCSKSNYNFNYQLPTFQLAFLFRWWNHYLWSWQDNAISDHSLLWSWRLLQDSIGVQSNSLIDWTCHWQLSVLRTNISGYFANLISDTNAFFQKELFALQFDCFFSQLTMYGSWFNKDGDRLTYFSGNEGENICACGQAEPNECYKRPHETQDRSCNCDAMQPISMSDVGLITNKVSYILMFA